MAREAQFKAVVLAAGRGNRMLKLSSGIPKCLLPLCNQPILLRVLRYLAVSGVTDVLVTVPDKCERDVAKILADAIGLPEKISCFAISDDKDWGTADTLRKCLKEINAENVIVVSCDLMTDFPLQKLLNHHLNSYASFTCLLSRTGALDGPVPGPKLKQAKESDIVGIEPKSKRLVYFYPEAEPDEKLTLNSNLLIRYPHVETSVKLLDAHLYIFRASVLKHFLYLDNSASSIKVDIIPRLLKAHLTGTSGEFSGDSLKCFSLVADQSNCTVCTRCNKIGPYFELNKQFLRFTQLSAIGSSALVATSPVAIPTSSTIGNDSVVGEDSRIGEKVQIKHSVIGRHCSISDKAKVANSLLMDHVTIGEGAEVGDRSELKDCIIACNQKTKTAAKLSNEFVTDARQSVMEL